MVQSCTPEKQCICCGTLFPETHFSKWKKTRERKSVCKDCIRKLHEAGIYPQNEEQLWMSVTSDETGAETYGTKSIGPGLSQS